MRDIYINSNLNPLTKFTSSSRSTEFKDILPWNISQMITKTIPISTRIVISHVMKRAILFLVGVLLCLYFGSNTVCFEVLHLSFIAQFILVNYFVCLLVFLFIQLCTVNIQPVVACVSARSRVHTQWFSVPGLC